MSAPNGILVVDKPAGWTSHDVVGRVRRLAGIRKVGHAGTLDPMATGVLIVGLGPSTRLLTHIVGADKEYTATVRLGASSTTDDAEGELLGWAPAERVRAVTLQRLADAVAQLTGEIDQVPSSVSAIKVDGKRSYARVRAGEQVELKARPVTVSEFEVLAVREVTVARTEAETAESDPDVRSAVALDVDVRVVCSSGTYIRALARDLGLALLTGGHLTALRRTRVGPFRIEAARQLETLDLAEAMMTPAGAASQLFPVLSLTEEQAVDLGHGKRPGVEAADVDTAAAVAPDGRLVALVGVRKGTVRVTVGFPNAEPNEKPNDEEGA